MENLDYHYHLDENDDYVCPDIMIVCDRKKAKIYYLKDGRYVLEHDYILRSDMEDEDYNAEQEICLKAFSHIRMILGEIFESVD